MADVFTSHFSSTRLRKMSEQTIWRNARIATLHERDGDPWGVIDDAAIVTDRGRIVWFGNREALPQPLTVGANEVDLKRALITPALIDCHTHLVYAGNRAREFEMRLDGATYEQIARAGGGIRSTVDATRAATDEALFALARTRALALMREGVATIEIKSGYGLTEHDEARSLAVARRVGAELGIDVQTTFLGAHALPAEFADRSDEYIEAVCDWLPRLHARGLVDAVDAFCENIGFTPTQTRRVFEAAKRLGLPVKLHAEQLSDQSGAQLAAEFGARSCDHLEYLGEAGADAMAYAGTVAVLLPTAFYFLRETKLPPIAMLREKKIPIALATDHNPGSSPTLSPLLVMNMACTLFRMTPLECWHGFTTNAAAALGMPAGSAMLSRDGAATFAIWNMAHPRELCYRIGGDSPLLDLVVRGESKFNREIGA
jgi:imidazolonepropionase